MSALRKKIRLIGPYALPILMAVAMVASTQDAFAGDNTNFPFTDDFESYTNGTPLINGTNGWYGSSSNIIVQTTTVRTGTNAAIIPAACTLSNRFQSIAPTNVWIQMDMAPVWRGAEITNTPVVDTNLAAMFYVNSNGNFMVHNGPASPGPTNSVNWVVVPSPTISPNVPTWVRINIYENFAQTNWSLYADGVLVTNNIGFINANLTNFAGFNIYNDAVPTSYLDNVFVTATDTNNLIQRPLIVIPPTPSVRNMFVGKTPSVQTAQVCNVWPGNIGFEITTNQSWIAASPANGNVTAGTTQNVALTYTGISGWPVGAISNAIMTVVATNGTDRWDTQTVSVLMNIMDLQVTPTNLTNAVWVGETPTNQTFSVKNAGAGSFTYTTATGAYWIACSPTSGIVGANSSNTLTLIYSNTAGWGVGVSNTTVTIASSDGGGATQTLYITLNVSNVQASMSVSPSVLSNVVWVGATPTNRTFEVRNSGGASLNFTAATTNTCPWITGVVVTPGTVPANGANVMTVSYGSTAGWTAGDSSNTAIEVVSTNGGGATQFVSVALSVQNILNVMDVVPANLTNGVAIPAAPSSQSFNLLNLSDADFPYTITTGATWITSVTPGTTLAARSTNVVTLTYASTTDWTPGQSNGEVTVTAAGASKTVGVTLYAYRSGITNTIPFYDYFEDYTNLTPLVGGINGWYGSSAGIIVQQDVKLAGLQAAMIPVDCTLSNPFVPASPTNVWIQMDVRPSLCEGTNIPVANTNTTWLFYINSNGNFVVHNGIAFNPTNSANWVTLTNGGIGTNGTNWVTIGIYEDFTRKKWDLYTNGVLVTNNINFVNPALTNFAGFDTYNGSQTSYLDNVSVTLSNRTAGYIGLSTTTLTYTPTYGSSPAAQTVVMTNLGQTAFTFSNTVTYGSMGSGWLTVTPVAGELAGSATQVLTCAVNSTNLFVGEYVATNTISSPGLDATNAPRTIVVTLTVGAASLTITANADSKTYGETKTYGAGQTAFTASGLQNGETVGSVTITASGGTVSNDNVGAYNLTPSAAAGGTFTPGNYTIGYNVGILTVNALAVQLTGSRAYDSTTAAAFGILSVTNKVGSDTVSVASGSGTLASKDVGSRAITDFGTLALGNNPAGNYTLSGASGSVTITQADQTIDFPAIPAQPLGNLTLTLSATASSGLTVSFTNTSVLGTNIVGTLLTFNGAGQYTIRASQTGDVNYTAAPTVSRTFPVYDNAAPPTTNTIPYTNNFEDYFNLVPLINGTNGWYGDSVDIIVQTNIVATGTNAAMIPVDCTLSNRFVVGTPLNVRMEMDWRPVRYEETNFPAVNTNAIALFYVDTNGHFVVCNGSSWCMVSNAVGTPGQEFVVTNDTWAHIVIYLNYRHRNWKLKANNVLITNKIGFVTQLTNGFSGFDVYNGSSSTSYLDNVTVNWWDRFKVNGVLDHLIRSVNGVIPDSIIGVPPP